MADISKIALPDGSNHIIKASKIPFGKVDSTSTSTAFTATVSGITALEDGVCCYLMNGAVTSAENFTVNINGLGAKPVYQTMAAATRSTTIFNVNYTLLFVYNSVRVSGGCWDVYYGYYSNTNTIGYQLRTNSSTKPMAQVTYRYRLLFESADGTKWVPANTSTSTSATASKTVNQAKINPWGEIVYYGTTASVAAGSSPAAANLWQQYTLTLGYSFNRTGAALTMTYPAPVYVKCAPQTDGSAIIDSATPFVQSLPTTADGKIYIFLGRAYSATAIELVAHHPVFYYSDGAIRLWTNSPTKVSAFTNDAGYLTTETDPTVPSWAKASTKPSYTASEVGALPSNTTYVSSVNGNSGAVTVTEGLTPLIGDTDDTDPSDVKTALMEGRSICILRLDSLDDIPLALEFTSWNSATDTVLGGYAIDVVISQTIASYGGIFYLFELVGEIAFNGTQTNQWYVLKTELAQRSDIPTSVSDLYNDEGFITTETDPTVPSWAKASTKPSYTASEVGALATTGGQLDGNVTLYSASGDSPAIIFQRGTLTDNYNDWRIMDSGGFLYFAQRGQNSSSFSNMVYFNTSGAVIATSFQGSAANLSKASTSAYGVTQLSTATDSTATNVAATPSAVKTAYDLANSANTTAGTALSGVNGTLIYDHTYSISNGVATFTPHVYLKGAEVTTDYATSCFGWKYRLIDGTEVSLTTKSDRGCDVTISNMGYGGHVIGTFTPT